MAIFLVSLCSAAARAESARPVDLTLVFAVDASDSIEPWEWELEMAGIAAALRDPDVHAAIATLPNHAIALAVLVWADLYAARPNSGWRLIDSGEAADAFASELDGYQRWTGGGTAMGEGVAASIRLIARSPYPSPRAVIDVSGDGQEPISFFTSKVIFMDRARDIASAANITINGLSIDKNWPELFDWYRRNVQTGPGSFVMHTKSMHDFAPAFRLKLLRELIPEVSRLEPGEGATLAFRGDMVR